MTRLTIICAAAALAVVLGAGSQAGAAHAQTCSGKRHAHLEPGRNDDLRVHHR